MDPTLSPKHLAVSVTCLASSAACPLGAVFGAPGSSISSTSCLTSRLGRVLSVCFRVSPNLDKVSTFSFNVAAGALLFVAELSVTGGRFGRRTLGLAGAELWVSSDSLPRWIVMESVLLGLGSTSRLCWDSATAKEDASIELELALSWHSTSRPLKAFSDLTKVVIRNLSKLRGIPSCFRMRMRRKGLKQMTTKALVATVKARTVGHR